MIVEYLRYRVPDDRAAAFLAKAPQCVGYELGRCTDEPASHILRITWTSAGDHPDGFRMGEHFPGFLAEIRPYVDAVEEMRRYERAGGAEAFEELTRRFYDRVLADDVVGPLFARMDPGHPRHVAMWLAEVFGGAPRYTTGRGGYAHMLAQHLGRGITEARRRRWVDLLAVAADDVGLPADPEFRTAFMDCIEWGTRLAVAKSQPDASPVRQAPVPRWGWGAAPPCQG
ncbi:group II truncated hemoglobin [Actinomadura parmotrematis]|uniref:Antibiotic biosynthesis monooxygenase n=1 Tax=Actinomadura parmotrematis TaxID=2864039 RepID=A0ABS7FXC9_9ACTN|nr:antibiotic biosynthesis monooxygenase [Actinomadura parmotrematis]MBW8485076.1 antibiotic biosynthesis monooxygenase [Actinomadura parmotrematis]